MDTDTITDQFYTFYGVSTAPYDLSILSAQLPALLVLVNMISQLECKLFIETIKLEDVLNDIAKTPDGLPEVFASYIVPIIENYNKLLHKISDLKDCNEQFFAQVQTNIALRLVCSICITLIKSRFINSSLLSQLNEFSGRIGLFQDSKRGPLECPKGDIKEVPSSVSLTFRGEVTKKEGGSARNRTRGYRRNKKQKQTHKRRDHRRDHRRDQRGGIRWLEILTAIIATASRFAGISSTTTETAAVVGSAPERASAAPHAVSVATAHTASAIAVNMSRPVHSINYLASASGIRGAINPATGIFELAKSNASRTLAAPRSFAVTGPEAVIVDAVAGQFETLVSASSLRAEPETVELHTATGPPISIRQIYELPPIPGVVINVARITDIGRSAAQLIALQYVTVRQEIAMTLVSTGDVPITDGGYGVCRNIGIVSQEIARGNEHSVAVTFRISKGVVSFMHSHPPDIGRVHSFASEEDLKIFFELALRGEASTCYIATQTGLLLYTVNPELLKPLIKKTWRDPRDERRIAFNTINFNKHFKNLNYIDSEGRQVDFFSDRIPPGRYKVVKTCPDGAASCKEAYIPNKRFEKDLEISEIFTATLIPYQYFVEGEVYVPYYDFVTPVDHLVTTPPLPSAPGFTMSINTESPSLKLIYHVANHAPMVPRIPDFLSASISCADPRHIIFGMSNWEFQQSCLIEQRERLRANDQYSIEVPFVEYAESYHTPGAVTTAAGRSHTRTRLEDIERVFSSIQAALAGEKATTFNNIE